MRTVKEIPEGYRLDTDGSLACLPGVAVEPISCDRHPDHYWCDYCLGYYGVPHSEDMHKGRDQHPLGNRDVRQCVCRFCIEEVARIELLSEVEELRAKALNFEGMKGAAVAVYWDFEYLINASNLIRITTGMERLSNSMSDLSSWVHSEIEQLREEDV